MTDFITIDVNDADPAPSMNKTAIDIEFFDPPMCCPTGLCGPTLDQTLLDVNEMIQAFQGQGLRVARYQIGSHPKHFMSNPAVLRLVRENKVDALPITVVRGRVIKAGAYPTRDEIQVSLTEVGGQ
ncbi:Arsenical resistance operon trans-acting repressor ArsD [Candidatus Promineifilum breve]|uniref:Arsenical resistance operon trans-acting repressor ArsD n=1 Tax=Candidatus Promineifilum breve TaxID=1806508 RepID=A0A160T7N1_9CHLR|nr:arsenite efflux transporter metallochaperone ArsD [Candidatus Promineifilum breve]CUS05669.1 Arsenical resistance operon trans-acting repressor ArsD [Candidatus Promineifilum breve]